MMNSPEVAKHNMIEQQIRPWEVLDSQVLDVLNAIDRAGFVKDHYKGLAYADCQIPLANQTAMFPPVIEGRLLQALLVNKDDSILEIGSGSGYISACLATLGNRVLSLDSDADNLSFAQHNASQAGLNNIEFKLANGLDVEYDERYDVIAVTGSVNQVPENLKQALRPGGRMFVIEGQSPVMQALLITRTDDAEWTRQSLFETDLPALQA
ncbi:MAG: protein-L-isoaspartate O-methyltransferase [Gammaproteobacteria bacterium]|nr:protein-L-isoaspartate O-methyltransferase [Gammaproteobacteria bacterium]